MIGRACHALEINPAYCDVTIERWQNFTGEKATLEDRAYDADDDIRKSVGEGFAAIRARKAAGGPGWSGHE